MAPQLPPLGPRAPNAFGQRTGPALAADFRAGLIGAEVLEIEELIKESRVPYIEEALNVERAAVGLPALAFTTTLEAIKDVVRGQNARIQALGVNLTTAEMKKIFEDALAASKTKPSSSAVDTTAASLYKEMKEAVKALDGLYTTLAEAKAGDGGTSIAEAASTLSRGLEDTTDAINKLYEKLVGTDAAGGTAKHAAAEASTALLKSLRIWIPRELLPARPLTIMHRNPRAPQRAQRVPRSRPHRQPVKQKPKQEK